MRKVYSTGCLNEELWFDCCQKPRVQPGFGAYSESDGMVAGGSFPGGKKTKFETDYSPSYSTELTNEWVHTSILTFVFIACTGTQLS
jgi:hypothetical protein